MAPLLDGQSGISALLESIEKFAWVSGQQCGLVVIKANCTLGWIKRSTSRTWSEGILSLCWSLCSCIWHPMPGLCSITTGKCGKPCASPTEPISKVEKGLRELEKKKRGEGRPSRTKQSREWVPCEQNSATELLWSICSSQGNLWELMYFECFSNPCSGVIGWATKVSECHKIKVLWIGKQCLLTLTLKLESSSFYSFY